MKKKNENYISDRQQQGFSLVEIIIVVALVAYVYSVALPNLGLQSETEIFNSLGKMNSDIRAAYDRAVLSGKHHRLVFLLSKGKYWLEETEAENFYWGTGDSKDLTAQEEKDKIEEFSVKFEKYIELAGEPISNPDGDEPFPAVSPILKAKKALEGPKWKRVSSLEWGLRTLNEALIIKSIQAEHHSQGVSIEEDPDARAIIYIAPGYLERAVFHIYYRLNDNDIDPDKEPYTILTKSYRGEATIESGFREVNVKESDGEQEEDV